jgi:Ca2+-transporting ATPase
MGWERKELTAGQPEVLEVAFDRDTQMMATVHADGDRYLTAVKGAPEAVLAVSSHISGADGPTAMGSAQRRQWRRQSDTFARDGLRVLALASKPQVDPDSDPYGDLVFRGLVALEDPPRRGVADAVGACKGAGTAVAMVTGDHPDTAASIAARVGIADRDAAEAVTGAELQTLSGEAGRPPRDVLDTRVFARVSPKQKLDLIALHQAHGAVVAMTGDGVNDAPALKKADIGIAMGHRGTQVAKEAADMVLQDDAFGTIVSAIAQGRAIFANIRKFILFLLSGNVGEILIVAIAILTGAPLPLLPLQILYLNMIGDVFPALAMAAGDGDDARMQAPPRDQKEAILTRRHWLAVGLYGGVIAVAALAAFWTALHLLGYDTARAVTISFLTLSFARLWHVFNMRSAGTRLLDNDIVRNPFIWGALALCTALLLMAVYLPALPQLLKLVRPTGFDWGIILGFSTLPLVIGQLLLPLVNRD